MSEGSGTSLEAARSQGSLEPVALLGSLSKKARDRLSRGCQSHAYHPGEIIIERGETSDHVCFLLVGKARVLNYTITGRVVSYATVEAGGFFGELAAIDGRPRTATVVAESPCRIAIMPAARFRQLATSNPAIALSLLKRMAEVIRASDDRILELTSLGAHERICLLLLRMADQDPAGRDERRVYPLPSQEMMAGLADTTRQTVFRVFRRLTSEGVIRRERGGLCIRNPKYLESKLLLARGD